MTHTATEKTNAFFERARQVMPFGVSSNFRYRGEGKDIGVARAKGAIPEPNGREPWFLCATLSEKDVEDTLNYFDDAVKRVQK